MKTNTGFTLIELLLTMIISLWLSSMLFAVYGYVQKVVRMQAGLIEIEENNRFIAGLFKQVFQLASNTGCINFYLPMIHPYSNGFTVWQMSSTHALLVDKMKYLDIAWLTNNLKLVAGNTVMITDCKTAEVLTIREIKKQDNQQKIEFQVPAKKHYEKNAIISLLKINSYFIAKTPRNIDALYTMDNHHQLTALVDNMTDLQIQYTVEEDGWVNERPASEVVNWQQVKGISLRYTLMTEDKTVQQTRFFYAAI